MVGRGRRTAARAQGVVRTPKALTAINGSRTQDGAEVQGSDDQNKGTLQNGIWVPEGHDTELSAGYWTEEYGDKDGCGPAIKTTNSHPSAYKAWVIYNKFLVVTTTLLPPKRVILSAWMTREVKSYSGLSNKALHENWPANFDSNGDIKLSSSAFGYPSIGSRKNEVGILRYRVYREAFAMFGEVAAERGLKPRLQSYKKEAKTWTFTDYIAYDSERIHPYIEFDQTEYADVEAVKKAIELVLKDKRIYVVPNRKLTAAKSSYETSTVELSTNGKRIAASLELDPASERALGRINARKRSCQPIPAVPSPSTNNAHNLQKTEEAVAKIRFGQVSSREQTLLDYIDLLEAKAAVLNEGIQQQSASIASAKGQLLSNHNAVSNAIDDTALLARYFLHQVTNLASVHESLSPSKLIAETLVSGPNVLRAAGYFGEAKRLEDNMQTVSSDNIAEVHIGNPNGLVADIEDFLGMVKHGEED